MSLSPEEEAAVIEYSGEFLEAARYGELDDLKLIFEHPRLRQLIDFKTLVDEASSTSPLMYAAANGHLECVVFLIESVHVDVNYANSSGNTALHWAGLNGHAACVEYLVSKGGDVLKENKFHRTPFDEAIARDQKDCCEILVKEEVRLNQLEGGTNEDEEMLE
jgi:ankyrin repeat protein